MSGLKTLARSLVRSRTLPTALAGAAVLVVLAIIGAGTAHATGCTDAWTNTEGGNWFTGSNWSKGAPPTSSEEACVTASGTYTVTMTQTSESVSVKSLTIGGESGTQTVAVGSSCSRHAELSATNGIAVGSHGVLTMTNGDGCGNNVTIATSISNSGAVRSEPATGGARTIDGAIFNKGTIAVNTATTFAGGEEGSINNEGAVNVAAGKQLTVSSGLFLNQTGGKIAASGSGLVFMSSKTSFHEEEGTTSGSLPVVVDDAQLVYGGTSGGESTIAVRGEGSTIVGGLVAKQTLLVQSTCGEHAKLEGTFSNGGSVVLTNGDGCGNHVTIVGNISNTGTITTEPATGGQRNLRGNLTNKGTVNVNTTTSFSGTSTTLTNEGAINIANGAELAVSSTNKVVNGSGGSIAGGTSGHLVVTSGTFTEGAGTTSGTLPVIVAGAVAYESAGGASTIALRNEGSTLSGSSSAGQSLQIQSTCGSNASVTASAGFTNGGSITLTNGDGCGNHVTLAAPSGMTSSGSITTEPATGGQRNIQGELTNTGTITANAATTFSGTLASLVNRGTLHVAEGVTLTISGFHARLTDGTGGSITTGTTGHVFIASSGEYRQGAGTTTGTLPVIVDDGAVAYEGAGAGTVAQRGEGSTLSGATVSGQTLILQSTCGEHVRVHVASAFTNGGSIVLTNGDGCGNNAALTVEEGATLTSSGSITTEPATGGARSLEGNITNSPTGTIAVNANNSTYSNASPHPGTLLNEGAITVASGITLTVQQESTVTNKGGTITGTGTGVLFQHAGTFNEGEGKTAGTQPVVLDDSALHYTGKGTGPIAIRGEGSTLSGTVNPGQILALQSTCGEHVRVTAAASFVSSGTIKLTNGDGCGNNATLDLAGGTLENKGTLTDEFPTGGARVIEGSVKNEKTLIAGNGGNLKVTGGYTQGKKGTFTVSILNGASYGSLTASSASIAGNLALKVAKGFLGSLGQNYNVLSAPGLTGTFAKEKSAGIKNKALPGLYYRPTYSATSVTLVVTQLKIKVEPTEGPAGSTVKISGTGYPAGDTVKLSFLDAKKVKTTFPNASANASGEFTTEVTLPAGVAAGTGTFTAQSGSTAVKATAVFKVT